MKRRLSLLVLLLVFPAAVIRAQSPPNNDLATQNEIVVDGDIGTLDTVPFTCVPLSNFKDGDKVSATTEADNAWSNTAKQIQIGQTSLSYPLISTVTDDAGVPQVLLLATVTLKSDLNSVVSLHKNGFLFTSARTFKSTETIPVLLIGGTIVSLEMTANPQDANDFKPALTIYADDLSASDRASAMSAWKTEMKHVRK